jgi:hypothetical protein
VRPSAKERRAYRAAEDRIRQSIDLRDTLPGHTYPLRDADLETMRLFHRRYGDPRKGFLGRLKRVVGGGR